MARRQAGTAVLDPPEDDWATRWLCRCGYTNAGRGRCLQCGRRASAEVASAGGLSIGEREPVVVQSRQAGRKAGRTVAAVIGMNLVLQVVLIVAMIAGNVDRAASVRLSLFAGLGYYTCVAMWVLARSAGLGLRADLGRDGALVGAAEGIIVGAGVAALLVAVLRLAVGHPVLDPTSAVLAGGSVGALLFGVLLIAVLGPVVEELVFRGFLAEAFRDRGRRSAVLISAVAFSLAHLRLAQFRYYLAMGVVFGLIYWRRGLIGSVCAHAAFNGMLILVAVAAIHGPPTTVHTAAGATVVIPAAWTTTDVFGDDLAVSGPLGTTVELTHIDGPLPDIALLARGLASGAVPLPSRVSLDYASVAVVALPAGQAVSMTATIDGRPGRVVMVPKGSRLWLAAMRSGGASRAGRDFDGILNSWRLP